LSRSVFLPVPSSTCLRLSSLSSRAPLRSSRTVVVIVSSSTRPIRLPLRLELHSSRSVVLNVPSFTRPDLSSYRRELHSSSLSSSSSQAPFVQICRPRLLELHSSRSVVRICRLHRHEPPSSRFVVVIVPSSPHPDLSSSASRASLVRICRLSRPELLSSRSVVLVVPSSTRSGLSSSSSRAPFHSSSAVVVVVLSSTRSCLSSTSVRASLVRTCRPCRLQFLSSGSVVLIVRTPLVLIQHCHSCSSTRPGLSTSSSRVPLFQFRLPHRLGLYPTRPGLKSRSVVGYESSRVRGPGRS
jgi:hypothetical protein